MAVFSRWNVKKTGRIFEGPEKVFGRNIEAGLSEVAAFGERTIKKQTPKGVTKILVGSIFGEVNMAPKPRVLFGTSALYGPVVEEGRRPGATMPPPDALRPWVERKLGVRREESKRVAFVVARSIGKKGTKARKMFEKSIPAIRRFALKTFGLRTKRIADELNR